MHPMRSQLPLSLPSFSDSFTRFLTLFFDEAGSDLLPFSPPDFRPNPPNFLPRVTDPSTRKWALHLHATWLQLARQVAPVVATSPALHTLVWVPHPVVIPGGRFREVYYWDSYWVVRLAVSGYGGVTGYWCHVDSRPDSSLGVATWQGAVGEPDAAECGRNCTEFGTSGAAVRIRTEWGERVLPESQVPPPPLPPYVDH